jgi:hypothetical protein
MRRNKQQDDAMEQPVAEELQLLAELEQLVDRLPPHYFAEVVGSLPVPTDGSVMRGRGDDAMPFLLLIDTRLN